MAEKRIGKVGITAAGNYTAGAYPILTLVRHNKKAWISVKEGATAQPGTGSDWVEVVEDGVSLKSATEGTGTDAGKIVFTNDKDQVIGKIAKPSDGTSCEAKLFADRYGNTDYSSNSESCFVGVRNGNGQWQISGDLMAPVNKVLEALETIMDGNY